MQVELADRLTPDWHEGSPQYFCRTFALPVAIEDGCWVGGGVIIVPGVTIGKGSVIGAGSVVTKDIPANSLAVGNPCRVLRQFKLYFYFKKTFAFLQKTLYFCLTILIHYNKKIWKHQYPKKALRPKF
jgi:hypothetical protein